MNKDIVPELLEEIKKQFESLCHSSDVLKNAFNHLKLKKVNYETVNELAIEIGNILSKVLGNSISGDRLPDGKMYYNIAKRLLDDTLGRNFDIVSGYARDVQQLLNKQAKLGLKAQLPSLNKNKIDGLVNRLSSADDFESVKWLLGDPIVTFTQGIVDDAIRENVEFHAKAGLSPKIIRTHTGDCCDWCKNLAGIYNYPKFPEDVYHRHGNCRCTVNYFPGDGKKQNVWSKIWNKTKNRDKMEDRKSVNLDKNMSAVRAEALRRGIETNPIKKSLIKKAESAIIKAVGGGDLTQGSCSSLAFAYIGNKAGYDVLDYRDGESRELFASNKTIIDIAQLPNVDGVIVRDKNDYSAVRKLLPYMKDGKEYYLATGRHATIVRKNAGGYEYLELQDSIDNGFKPFTNSVLKNRFACQKSYSSYGLKFEMPNILIDVETLGKNEEFQKLLPFINTKESKQRKGSGGHVR
ncbi:hypothetical protein KG090_00570 [Carnobacteriaceae bacterium zg-ZUI240]|nr:hypothetical protein [Carnobacteriaceae bacterium zg-ZUI240]